MWILDIIKRFFTKPVYTTMREPRCVPKSCRLIYYFSNVEQANAFRKAVRETGSCITIGVSQYIEVHTTDPETVECLVQLYDATYQYIITDN